MSKSIRTHILIRVTPGKESRVSEDLEDFFYPYDQSVRSHRTPYHGLVILETRLVAERALELLRRCRIGYLKSFTVLDGLVSVSNWMKILEIISKKIPREYKISLKVKVRGRKQELNELMDLIREEIVKRGYTVSEEAKLIVRLETLDVVIGIVIENI